MLNDYEIKDFVEAQVPKNKCINGGKLSGAFYRICLKWVFFIGLKL
jgi:hypothetical protein